MHRVTVVLAAALVLGACQPRNDAGAPAEEPASAPASTAAEPAATETAAAPTPLDAAFAGDLNAQGTEPFWAVEIRAGALTLKRPDHPELAVSHAGAKAADGAAVWSGGQGASALSVTLTKAACSDGMSDRAYPLTADVRVGGETLKGCAAAAG